MGKLKIKKEIIEEGIKIFNEKQSYITEFNNVIPAMEFDIDGNYIDARDFTDMGILLPITGDSPAERKQNFQREYKKMLVAFASGKTEERAKYLDMLFDNFEKVQDYYKNGVNTVEDFLTCAGLEGLGQCIAVKRNENLDWYYKKYNDQEKFKKLYNSTMIQESFATDMQNVSKEYPEFKPKPVQDMEFMAEQSGTDMYRVLADGIAKANADGTPDIIPFKMPARIRKEANEANYKNTEVIYLVGEKMLADSGFRPMMNTVTKAQYTDVKAFDDRKFTFIGDKSLLDLATEELRKTKDYQDPNKEIEGGHLVRMAVTLFNKAMMNGDKVVSFVTPAMKDGKIELSVKKIKPDVSNIKESILSEHSWFRRTFFNWGPFKIATPDQSKIDKLYRDTGNALDQTILNKAQTDLDDTVEKEIIRTTQADIDYKKSNGYQNTLDTIEKNKVAAQKFIERFENSGFISFNDNLKTDIEKTETVKEVAPKIENTEVNKTINIETGIE